MNAPDVAFLGVCDRAIQITNGELYSTKQNILGLKSVIMSSIYPLNISGLHLVFAVYDPFNFKPARIVFLSSSGEEQLCIDINLLQTNDSSLENKVDPETINDKNIFCTPTANIIFQNQYPVWSLLTMEINNTGFAIEKPGQYKVILRREDFEVSLGCLSFGYVPAEPLTEDRVAAIKSNPNAARAIKVSISCNKCNRKLSVYCAIERKKEEEVDGVMWYKDLTDSYLCKCKKTIIDLKYLRNLHVLLGEPMGINNEISFTKFYELDSLNKIYHQFNSLVSQDPTEEKLQLCLENNPIILHQFSPRKIFFKSPILTKYNTDIVILNHKKELLLIELEKSGTRLLTKNGGIASALQHPLDQVRDWLHMTDEHRIAVLECIGLKSEEVSSVKGIVIAGRDLGYEPEHLRKLKWTDFGRINFFTYNDLLGSLSTLINTFGNI